MGGMGGWGDGGMGGWGGVEGINRGRGGVHGNYKTQKQKLKPGAGNFHVHVFLSRRVHRNMVKFNPRLSQI